VSYSILRRAIDTESSQDSTCARAIVGDGFDWSCNIVTNFQEKNLGCARGVSGAIDWFFNNVEQGIILEDDIVVGEDFFPFMWEMLGRYREDPRVFSVTGSNRIPRGVVGMENQYRFCSVPQVWG